MADLKRNTSLVPIEGELAKKHAVILINEKLSSIAAHKQRRKDLIDIEANKIDLAIEVLEKEIELIKQHKIIGTQEEPQ